MIEIPLSNSTLVTLIDDEDWHLVVEKSWYLRKDGYITHSFYVPEFRNSRFLRLHRVITEAKKGEHVDHIDLNKLNNCKSNLRLCSQGQNQRNLGIRRTNTSGFKGVVKHFNKWVAQIQHVGVNRYLGLYDSKEEAASAYDLEAVRLFGEFAKTNAELRAA